MVPTMFPSIGEAIRPRPPAPPVSAEDDRTVVWLNRAYDIATLTALAAGLAAAVALDDADLVVVLSEVQFIVPATIGMLVRARSRRLTVRNPPRCAQRVLDVCRLADLTDTEPADAGRAMGSCPPAVRIWGPGPPTDRADPGSRRSGPVCGDPADTVPLSTSRS